MNNISKLVLSAMLGSALSIGAFQFYGPKETITTVRPTTNTVPSLKTSYANYSPPSGTPVDFTFAAEKSMSAVVHIKSIGSAHVRNQYSNIPDAFRFFFGDEYGRRHQQTPRERVATGSGVIINSEGYIVTNNHVIKDADEIEVSLHDNNKTYTAEVIGTDPSTDIALLKIKETNLPFLSLMNSEDVKVGEWVLAVGNPFNLNSTVTAGIVSAKGRNLNIIDDQNRIESFIQTDAAVNPGNSGGALVNLNGNLIGINTAIASPTGSFSGYSFAIPSNIVNKVVNDLMEYGTVQRGYLGIYIQDVNSQLAKEEDLEVTEGVYINNLVEDGSAEQSGIKIGDVIRKVDGKEISTVAELQGKISQYRPGDNVKVQVNRFGKEMDIAVTLKNSNGNTEIVKKEEVYLLSNLGAELKGIDKEKAQKLGISGGVQVEKLTKGKLRKYTTMEEGFIITRVDGQKVASAKDIQKILKNKAGGVMIEGIYPGYNTVYYFAIG
ncbi:Do family serine endopeptidase, partial [Xanthovirga aplysinae]|uniref:Do family serine endopeptidase n=1 Tax=Xanthovirga aplysinae TaxID=2529853 RepID=UPI0012BC83AF